MSSQIRLNRTTLEAQFVHEFCLMLFPKCFEMLTAVHFLKVFLKCLVHFWNCFEVLRAFLKMFLKCLVHFFNVFWSVKHKSDANFNRKFHVSLLYWFEMTWHDFLTFIAVHWSLRLKYRSWYTPILIARPEPSGTSSEARAVRAPMLVQHELPKTPVNTPRTT